ncbi:MAG: hypothetical protein ACI837_002587 [Crocinitomicaceae bacterium]|jgi:hypothetical protein
MIKSRIISISKGVSSVILFALFSFTSRAQDSDSPFVNYDQFEALVKEVRQHRKERLLNMDDFNAMSIKEGVFILDTRLKAMYDAKHIKGAVHLNFSDFTQVNLDNLFGSRDASVLIYCNNNIDEETEKIEESEKFFRSKRSGTFVPLKNDLPGSIVDSTARGKIDGEANGIQEKEEVKEMIEKLVEKAPPITLALNIPTYINLFGYGYKNVYELKDLVSVNDPRIEFEGTFLRNKE